MMSDIEEPPAKVLKIQVQKTEEEEKTLEKNGEESQEEWLSEGVLTEDDLLQTAQAGSVDDVTNASQDDSAIHSMSDPIVLDTAEQTPSISAGTSGNFDTTAGDSVNPQPMETNTIDDGLENKMKARIDELDEYLLKNEGDMETDADKADASDVKAPTFESDIEESPKHTDEDDDGNNTDDLLRMLGEDDSKKAIVKKRLALTAVKQKDKNVDTDEDSYDEEIFEGAQIKTYKLSKNAIIRKREKQVTDRSKRESDYKYSSDEEDTLRKVTSKTGKNDNSAISNKVVKNVSRTTPKAPSTQTTSKPSDKNTKTNKHSIQTSSKSESTKRTANKVVRHSDKSTKHDNKSTKHTGKATNRNESSTKHNDKAVKHDEKVSKEEKTVEMDGFCEEEFKEEEYLEDEDFSDMNDYLGIDGDVVVKKEDVQRARSPHQPIMRPERMDEDIPSDMDTEASDYSFYDELPSSDSEGVEEWFTLDIRSERAGDYIPLLGDKAEIMLETERRQVAGKLSSLREGLRELSTKSEEQTNEMVVAKKKLIKLDALLSHT